MRLPKSPPPFAYGRYQGDRFLGEGGKKRVELAHVEMFDRDVRLWWWSRDPGRLDGHSESGCYDYTVMAITVGDYSARPPVHGRPYEGIVGNFGDRQSQTWHRTVSGFGFDPPPTGLSKATFVPPPRVAT